MLRPTGGSAGAAALWAVTVFSGACGGGGGGGDPTVAVGTGCFGAFEALRDDGEAILEPGNQGLQHVWMTARASGLPERGLVTTLRIRTAGDGAEPATTLGERDSSFTYERFDGVAGGAPVLSGIRVVVDDADTALAGPVILEVAVRDREAPAGDPPLARDAVAGIVLREGDAGCDR